MTLRIYVQKITLNNKKTARPVHVSVQKIVTQKMFF